MELRQWIGLVSDLQHAQCVLILGPEIPIIKSANERGESVVEVISDQLKGLLGEDLEPDTFASLAVASQHYADQFGEHSMRGVVASLYNSYELTHQSYIHSLIASLPFHLILTTAHDNFLWKAFCEVGKKPLSMSFRYRGTVGGGGKSMPDTEFGSNMDPQSPYIYHLFGSSSEPNEMVISEEDVTDFFLSLIREKGKRVPPGLVSSMHSKTHRYLFLGFGIRQLHLRVLIKLFIKALLDNPRGNHHVVTESLKELHEKEVKQTVRFFQRGTKIDIENSSLVSFLEELTLRFQQAGGYRYTPEKTLESSRLGVIKAFISYAREDSYVARRLYSGLEKAGVNAWIDQFCLIGGQRWDPELREQIESADFVLVILSSNLVEKTDSYVNKEIEWAIERSKRVRPSAGAFLIPLVTSNFSPGDSIPELDDFHRLPLTDDNFEEDLIRLVSDLRKNIQRRKRG